ncbi:MAG TPA: TIR domain-containing protein, partial [Solirubrobacterales bacterium]|nr:TIR domain-containing protein [Solirubrobacterales bacterium]
MGPVSLGERLGEWIRDLVRELDSLRSMVDRLELFEVAAGVALPDAPETVGRELSNRVFVIHGRQRDSADVVARFVAKLGLEAVILDEQANEGRTILEKLEANTEDVGFAVVLLQADDHGRGLDEEDWPDDPNRARWSSQMSNSHPTFLALPTFVFDESWQLRLA